LGTYHWGVFAVFRTLSVIGSAGVGVTYFVLVMESIGPKYRPICGLLYISTTIGLGTIMLTFVVAFLKNWEYAQFFMAFTAIFVGFTARACSESPRYILKDKLSSNFLWWLYSVKKSEDAREALQRMAKWQGYRIDSDQFEAFEKNMVGSPAFVATKIVFLERR
jgi:MFS family permease